MSRKITCCGTDPSAHINNSDHGVSIFCHRCGKKEFSKHGERSLAEIMATRRAEERLIQTASMPADAVALMEGPPAALLWVLAGGLQPEMAHERYGFRWHEASRRVVIPLERGLLGRAVHGERPKYRLYGATSSFSLAGDPARATVVVEDVLSAIAVHRAGWPAFAVLGTAVSDFQAAQIAAPRVIGWFDDDPAGDKAWLRLRRKLALHPVTLTRVQTERDPKHIWRSEIKRILEQHHDRPDPSPDASA